MCVINGLFEKYIHFILHFNIIYGINYSFGCPLLHIVFKYNVHLSYLYSNSHSNMHWLEKVSDVIDESRYKKRMDK